MADSARRKSARGRNFSSGLPSPAALRKFCCVSDKAPWITYRPELKVLDCTIRDGGLINNSQFSDEQVRAVYQTCLAAGVDYMEIGYKNSPAQFPQGRNTARGGTARRRTCAAWWAIIRSRPPA